MHQWRPRRSRCGELVQWDTSEHDWLEGRGEKLYLIAMIDDATSRLFARFVRHDTTEENMKLLWRYVEKFGRPLAFYTDKASMFQTAEKHKRDEPGVEKDRGGDAADADRARVTGVGNRVDCGAHSASERPGGEEFWDGTGPAGERNARGGSEDDGTSQPIPGGGLSGVVGAGVDGGGGPPRRCASAAGEGPQSGGFAEPCGNAPSAE